MAYQINGTKITIQPTVGRWVPRELIDVDGSGHPIYPAHREYEMRWDLIDMAEASQLQVFFNAIQNTGTAVVTLPKYATTPHAWYSYTGCVLNEPEFNDFFEQHVSSVVLLVRDIHT